MIKINEMRYSIISLIIIALIFFMSSVAFSNHDKSSPSTISASLNKITKNNKDFTDLLLLISLIDCQNIPLDLLYTCKDKLIVDQFIDYLKQSFFIDQVDEENTISLNSMIHSNIKLYVNQQHNNAKRVSLIINRVNVYLNKLNDAENHQAMNNVINHAEAMLQNDYVIDDIVEAHLKAELGQIHHYLGHYTESKALLEESFSVLDKQENKDYAVIAKIYFYLGSIYRSLSDYGKGIEYMTKSLSTYQIYFPTNYKKIAQVSSDLGNVHRMVGNYHQASTLLSEALEIYQTHLPDDYLNISWIYLFLGYIEEELGHYVKAKSWFEQSLKVSKNHLPQNHLNIAWSLVHIGHVLRELGFYKEARAYMDEGLNIAKDQVSKDHKGYANTKIYLAKLENELGNYDKASTLFDEALSTYRKVLPEESIAITNAKLHLIKLLIDNGQLEQAAALSKEVLAIYEKNYSNQPRMAKILKEIGYIGLLQGNLTEAEGNLQKAAEIFKRYDHYDYYFTLEILSDLYLKKYEKATQENLSQKLRDQYITKSRNLLQEAINGIKAHYPPNSAHLKHLYSKINN